MKSVLKDISSYKYRTKLGPQLPAHAHVEVVESTDEFERLKEAFENKNLTESDIREFVSQGIEKVEKGKYSYMNIPFSVLACASRYFDYSYTNEFLNDLSSLDSAELGFASRVAEYCLENKKVD